MLAIHHKKEKHKEPASVETDKQPIEDGKIVMGSAHPENDIQAEKLRVPVTRRIVGRDWT